MVKNGIKIKSQREKSLYIAIDLVDDDFILYYKANRITQNSQYSLLPIHSPDIISSASSHLTQEACYEKVYSLWRDV